MLEGQGALITGSGRGIGRAIAPPFAREGADIAVLDVHRESCRHLSHRRLPLPRVRPFRILGGATALAGSLQKRDAHPPSYI